MKPKTEQRPDLRSDRPTGAGHIPEFESDQHAEWRVIDGGEFILRLDRTTGAWSGEQQGPDEGGSTPLSPQEVEVMVRARDLRFRDGTRAG